MNIEIPTINYFTDPKTRYAKLINAYNQILQSADKNIYVSFRTCKFLSADAIAFLGGMLDIIKSNRIVDVDFGTLDSAVKDNLVYHHFIAGPIKTVSTTAIPYRNDKSDSALDPISDYLYSKVLDNSHINLSNLAKTAIVSRLYEFYANSFQHSKSTFGVYSCGQFYPRKNEFQLSVIDFGVGIVESVRAYHKNQMLAEEALKWAFTKGNSTINDGVARGIGLDLILQFVKENNGEATILTNDGMAKIDKASLDYSHGLNPFAGTIVNIELKCDNRYYCMASELRK